MPEKDPQLWTFATWSIAVLMAAGGGVINWFSRVKTGKVRPFSFIELIGEMFTSGFTGIGVAMVLASIGYDFLICAAAAGVGGHMATRLLFRIENLIEARLEKLAPGISEPHGKPSDE